MSDSTQRNAGIETPDAEVELSAQDLLELAGPCSSNKPEAAPPEVAAPKATTPAPALRGKANLRVYTSLALAITAVGVLYVIVAPKDETPRSQPIQQTQAQPAGSAANSESKPVLFANPFDANEVFEFPAGTSEAEARDAVAAILMERATERQREFDARVSNNS